MNFDQLASQMGIFETAHDYCVLPDMYMVARLDGHGFSKLTEAKFKKPFDQLFRDHMVATTAALMQMGFKVVYGYTQSDEISLLFAQGEPSFNRKLRKYESLLAGMASATFSQRLGEVAIFDCRISQLPNLNRVYDYFRWRAEDAHRNAINGQCYWSLRQRGRTAGQATSKLFKMDQTDKHKFLSELGFDWDAVPAWQKRGVALYWETTTKIGHNPLTDTDVEVERRKLRYNYDLPSRDAYGVFLADLLKG